MLRKANNYLKHQTPTRVLIIASIGLLIVGYLDWMAGRDMRVGIFGLVPLVLTAYFVGTRAGLLMALLTTGMWLALDLLGRKHYAQLSFAYVNAGVRFAFYVLTIYVVSGWRRIGESLENLVEKRTSELSAEVRERQQAEASLHKLAMQLADVEDAERRRLAHEIHDAVGQNLTVMKLRLESASADQDSTRQRAALTDCLNFMNTLIRQTRTLTFELHPPMLEDLGLIAALNWYAKTFNSQTKSDLTITDYGDPVKLPLPISSYLFRSIKELAANAVKHGRASEVVVSVYWRPTSVRVVVDDNGAGFDVQPILAGQTTGLGLPGIRERANTLGGTFELDSQSEKGSRAIVEVPFTDYNDSPASALPASHKPSEAAAVA